MQLNSPSKLEVQIPLQLGCAEFTLQSTSVQWPEVSPHAICMVIASNKHLVVRRKTSTLAFNPNIHWNEFFEFRCGLDWRIQIAMIVEDSDGDEVILSTDNIAMESTIGTSQLLYLDNCCVGEVSFSFTFFPNYQSFKCLAIESTLHPSLPLRLTTEMLNLLQHDYDELLNSPGNNNNNDSDTEDNYSRSDKSFRSSNNHNHDSVTSPSEIRISNEDKAMLYLVGKQCQEYLQNTNTEGALSTYIYKLYIKSNTTVPTNTNNNIGEDATDGLPIGNDGVTTTTTNAESNTINNTNDSNDNDVSISNISESLNMESISLPLHKVATVVKAFLSSLTADLPQAPPVTMSLVEKQLALYIDTIIDTSTMQGTTSGITPRKQLFSTSGGLSRSGRHVARSNIKSYLDISNDELGGDISFMTTPGHGHVHGHGTEDNNDVDNILFTWSQLISLCIISSLWLLQQALSASNLLTEYATNSTNTTKNDYNSSAAANNGDTAASHLTLRELEALRFMFSVYDHDLSGEIPAVDLYYLLQDMGEEYTPVEMELILEDINPDCMNTVEIDEFIRWWCCE